MKIYLVAPFYTQFSLKSSKFLEDKDYVRFWTKAAKHFPEVNDNSIDFLHATGIDGMRFRSLSEDSAYQNEDIIRIHEHGPILKLISQAASEASGKFFASKKNEIPKYIEKSITFTLFDNTVGILEIEFTLPDNTAGDTTLATSIQQWSSHVCDLITNAAYRYVILPIINRLIRLDSSRRYLEKIGYHYGFPNIGERPDRLKCAFRRTETSRSLWVNRSIIVQNRQEIGQEFFNRWIFSDEGKTDIYNTLIKKSSDEKDCIYLGWGNNFICSNGHVVEQDAKKALILAQYYYTVLDNIGLNLSFIVSASKKTPKARDNKAYNTLLKELVTTANIIEIGYIDTLQNLQGNRKIFFKDLAEKWGFDHLISNINKKKEVCENLINQLYQQSFKKGQIMAELLLFFLGGISLLEFANTLVSYWSNNIGINDHIPGIYDIGKYFPPDIILWGAFFLLSVFFFIYFKFYINRKS